MVRLQQFQFSNGASILFRLFRSYEDQVQIRHLVHSCICMVAAPCAAAAKYQCQTMCFSTSRTARLVRDIQPHRPADRIALNLLGFFKRRYAHGASSKGVPLWRAVVCAGRWVRLPTPVSCRIEVLLRHLCALRDHKVGTHSESDRVTLLRQAARSAVTAHSSSWSALLTP